MVWGGLRLIVTIFLRVVIIVQMVQGMWRVGVDCFWETFFQLAVSPFNWIDTVMEDIARRVGRMLDEEAR
jgi:hypothetical protein